MRLATTLAAALLSALSSASAAYSQMSAITDVTVINPRSGAALPHRTVVLERTRIRSVQPASVKPPDGARLVPGKNKFLIPGLWDAHVHLTKAGALSLPLFVANGITGVRDMGSDFDEIAAWRSQIEAGQLIGPRIKTSGQILESRGNVERMKREGTVEPVDRIRMAVANPDEARAAVIQLARKGVDHIKMRTTPDEETFRAVAEEATRQHLPFAAHPLAPPEELMRVGLRSVEHFLEFPPKERTREERQTLFRKMADSQMFMSDTKVDLEALITLPYDEVKRRLEDRAGTLDERRRYVCGYLLSDWREQAEELKDPDTKKAYGTIRDQLPELYRNMREMRDAGVQFLAGTDTGVLLMYPGFSLHDELYKLVRDVGFTPMEVLRIATSNTASFYGQEKQYGAIEAGQFADLVLLDANPVADIQNTRKIYGVMTHGRWLDRSSLDTMLQRVVRLANSGCRLDAASFR